MLKAKATNTGRIRFVLAAFSVLALAMAFTGCENSESAKTVGSGSPRAVGQPIAVDSISQSLEQMKGKVVVLDLWATWCGPCRMEIPSFIKLQEKYQSQG